ncbi:hypothetical protein C8R47DRAFT_1323155 [Mycena vitilis]|nr:hypothetical protein C8R47DRAFT_1323155 [Mycena vitilis]
MRLQLALYIFVFCFHPPPFSILAQPHIIFSCAVCGILCATDSRRLTTTMENDAPPTPMTQTQTTTTSTLEKLRASERSAVELQGEVALLRLAHAHTLEDLAAARAECNTLRIECACSDAKTSERRAERERYEVRGKYEGLKRRFYEKEREKVERERERAGCKRRHEEGDERRRERDSGEMDMDCSSSPPTPSTRLPDPNTNRLGASIARKSSASSACSSSSSTGERDPIWPRSPALPVPPLPSSSMSNGNVHSECEWRMGREGSAEVLSVPFPPAFLRALPPPIYRILTRSFPYYTFFGISIPSHIVAHS